MYLLAAEIAENNPALIHLGTQKISYLSGTVMSKGGNILVRAFMKRFKIVLFSFFVQTKVQYTDGGFVRTFSITSPNYRG